MPTQIENFDENQLDVITSGTSTYTFDDSIGDYVRVSVYNQNTNNIVTLDGGGDAIFRSDNGDFVVYRDVSNKVYIKPNEVLEMNEVPQGNYRLQFDFLRNVLSGSFGV